MAEQVIPQAGPSERASRSAWWQLLLGGFGLFILGIIILVLTGNPNLIPVIIIIGNFTVPVAYVAFFYQRQHLVQLALPDMLRAFVLGGLLGVFAASLIEPLVILRLDFTTAFAVGLIEEFAKILGVVLVARHLPHNSELEGLLLGAATGMGFAAFESTGYAFVAFLLSRGSLSAIVVVILLRGFLSPAGHGTWAAILASVLFRESRPDHFRINRAVVTAYLGVSILHGLWDGLPVLLAGFVSQGIDLLMVQLIIGFIGLYILWRRWREANHRELENLVAG
jgi:RsiW-degrading membrane proteinase PrsW (M82 family)